jgi:integrase
MPVTVVEALKQHRDRQDQERRIAGTAWHDEGFIFTSTLGTPLDSSGVTRRFQKLLAEAGLPRLRFHDLRHSCASLLKAQGVWDKVIMEVLGHSSITTTMNLYTHVFESLKQDAADAVDRVLT